MSEVERDRVVVQEKLLVAQTELQTRVAELQRLRRDMTSQHGADCDVIGQLQQELNSAKSANEQRLYIRRISFAVELITLSSFFCKPKCSGVGLTINAAPHSAKQP